MTQPIALHDGDSRRLRLLEHLDLDNDAADPAFDRLARICVSATKSAAAGILFFAGADVRIRAVAGCSVAELKSFETACRGCLEAGEPIEVEDFGRDDRYVWPTTSDSRFSSFAAYPLRFDGLVLGALAVLGLPPGSMAEGGGALLKDLAELAEDILIQRHREAKGRQEQSLAMSLAQRLGRSEERLAMAQRVGGMGSWELDASSERPRFSAGILALLEMDSNEGLQTLEDFASHVHSEDMPIFRAVTRLGQQGNGQTQGEFRIVRPGGDARWLHAVCETHCDRTGKAVRHICAVIDVTARKAMEQELKQSEELYRLLWEVTTDVVVMLDESNVIRFANPAVKEVFGYSPEEIVGQDLSVLQPPALVDLHRAGFARYLATGQRKLDWRATEAAALHRDGHEFPVEIAFGDVRTGGQRLFAAFIRDIAVRKRQTQALEQSEARFKAMAELSSDWYWEADSNCRLTRVSGGRSHTHDVALQSLIGQAPWESPNTFIEPSELQIHKELVLLHQSFRDFEFSHRGADETLHFSVSGEPILDEGNGFVGYRGVGRDVTKQRQAEEERRALESQLRESQKMEAIGVLAGGIAHDFNNLLAAILGNASMALQDVGEQHAAAGSLHQILKASARGRQVVKQILSFARREPTRLVPCHLQALVSDTLVLLRSVLPAGVRIEAALASTPIWVMADGTQLDQVLINLCTNASQAIGDAKGTVTIGLEAVSLKGLEAHLPGHALPPGRYADLWVRDTGAGMSRTTLAKIFEPFFTTKTGDGGTGLGLAIVLKIVESHHGAIAVETAEGSGTTFHIRLPLIEASPPAIARRSDAAVQSGKGEHVMYVDDDEAMTLVVERVLERQGFRVTCCQDASEAVALIKTDPHAFDAVVTDFNMPAMSGLELARKVSGLRHDLPVVISSGYFPDTLRAEAERSGVVALFEKTATFEELGSTVRSALDGKQSVG